MALTAKDEQVLAKLNTRAAQISTSVGAVAHGYRQAFFLWGKGGDGKSYRVRKKLEQCVGWEHVVHHVGSSTAIGLFETLEQYPNRVHVLEECETLWKDRKACETLRSACQAPTVKGTNVRIVKRTKAGHRFQIEFTGGIIICSNENLAGNPILGAVASRMAPIQWQLNEDETIAMYRHIAMQGYQHDKGSLTAAECIPVAELLIGEIAKPENKGQFTIRTLCEQAFPAFMYIRDTGGDGLTWQDVVLSSCAGTATARTQKETRDQRNQRLQYLAAEVELTGSTRDERNKLWAERSVSINDPNGLEQAARYRWLKEAQESDVFKSVKLRNLETEKLRNLEDQKPILLSFSVSQDKPRNKVKKVKKVSKKQKATRKAKPNGKQNRRGV